MSISDTATRSKRALHSADDIESIPRHEELLRPSKRRRRWLTPAIVLVAACGAAAAVYSAVDWNQPIEDFVLHEVVRGDLRIEVTERGTLESQENIKILCEVDDIRGDSINGTPIIWLIENGTSVKKGDLLIEFASSGVQQELDEQILETEQARSVDISTSAKYENQITQNKTAEANAELAVKLADLELRMYTDKENGTHKLEVEEINRLIDDVNNEILAAQANLELKRNEKEGILALFKLGYSGKSEVDRTRLDYLQAESQFAAKINSLQTQLATLVKKNTYERDMQVLTLNGALATAKRLLEQVKLDNESLLAQALAAKQAAEESLKKEEERLARWKQQVVNCKVYAPQDGMVVYATGTGRRFWEEEVRVGAAVNPRQHVLSLPNLTKMQVRLAVHESVLNQVDVGTKATIRVEAFTNRTYTGQVQSVAVLAVAQGNATKVYDTVVTIDGDVENLRPGMTAIAQIHVEHLRDVITIPVQAVVQVKKTSWCYVMEDGRAERREIELGSTDDKFVEIRSGLEEGEQVILNPMAIVENEEVEVEVPSNEADYSPDEDPADEAQPPAADADAEPKTAPPVQVPETTRSPSDDVKNFDG